MGTAREPQLAQVRCLVTVILCSGCDLPPTSVVRIEPIVIAQLVGVRGYEFLTQVFGLIRLDDRRVLRVDLVVDDGFEFFVGSVTHAGS
jgi:hypothetical protein